MVTSSPIIQQEMLAPFLGSRLGAWEKRILYKLFIFMMIFEIMFVLNVVTLTVLNTLGVFCYHIRTIKELIKTKGGLL